MANATPVMIYAPGLARRDPNTADGIAAVLARSLDQRDAGRTYSTKADTTITAPRGLKVGSTIVDDQDHSVLQTFELDYRSRLERSLASNGPPTPPGIVASSKYGLFGVIKLVAAMHRPAKTWLSKLQLLYGFIAVGLLLFAWLVTVYAALLAAGVDLPVVIDGIFGDDNVKWTLGVSGVTSVVAWTAVRKWALALAATIRYLIDYASDIDRTRETVCKTLDDGIAGLLGNDWTGPIHLVGYSFGSLVLFDAVFPHGAAARRAQPVSSAKSLVTIGCPIDLMRLYFPSYVDGRVTRNAQINWMNVYNAADVFASNLQDSDDESAEGATTPASLSSFEVTSIRYLEERLTLLHLLMARGFRTHSGYWGTPDEGNCFDRLLDEVWVPSGA